MMAAPTLSSSRFSTRPATVSPVSWAVNSSISLAMARLEAVDAGDAVAHFEHGADFADIFGGEIRRRDLAQQDFLELAGTQNRFSGHGSRTG